MADDDKKTANILLAQFNAYLDVYRHHFDLYLKAIAIYLAVVGATAGFVFKNDIALSSRIALSLFIAVISTGSIAGAHISKKWVIDVENIFGALSAKLEIAQFPFSGAKRVLTLMIVLSSTLGAVGLVNALILISYIR